MGIQMRKTRFVVGWATVLLLVYGSWATTQASAAPKTGRAAIAARASLDPETGLSNDGAVLPAPEVSRHGVNGHRGTGKLSPTIGTPDNKTDPSSNGRESVIGTDDRTQVTNTTSFPNSAIVRISFSAGSCTGWLIGANTVATAGHCVAPGGTGGFYDPATYTIAPGQNGTSQPFGTCGARRLFSVVGWTDSANEAFDYGAIKLKCNIGNTTGWFGFFWTTADLTGSPATVTGYPGDKPFGTNWTHSLSIAVNGNDQLFYLIDTAPGQSGSPVWKQEQPGLCSGGCGMAIHAYGLHGTTPPHSDHNHGTRITEARFNNLINWRNAPK
jgi:glutamyl endopeptidase